MTIASDAALLREPASALAKRWGAALGIVLVAGALVGAGLVVLDRFQSSDGPPPAPIMLTLAPMPAAPVAPENNAPPGPLHTEDEPTPDDAPPKPDDIVPAKKADIPAPSKRPKPEPKAAPAVSAPPAAPNIAPVAAAPIAGAGTKDADARTRWQAQLRVHLERYKRYPRDARLRGDTGTVTLAFAVDRAGNVLSSAITHSSGFPALDRETVTMLKRAAPLPPPPPEITGARIEITIPIEFNLE